MPFYMNCITREAAWSLSVPVRPLSSQVVSACFFFGDGGFLPILNFPYLIMIADGTSCYLIGKLTVTERAKP